MKTKRIISIIALSAMIAVLNIAPVLATQNNTTNTSPTNTPAANVSQTITKDYTFTTETKPFKYDAPKTVKENGYEYKYKDISYKETSATQPVTTSKTYTGLTSKSVPNSITYNGQTLYLKDTPTYTSHTTPAQKSTKTVTDTKTYNSVVPGTESSVIKDSVKKDGVTLKKASQSYTSSSSNYTDTGVLASYDHDMNVSGTSIQLTDGTPEQGNWQSDLHSYFELPSSTSITSAAWATDIQHQSGSGKYTRSVRYSGQQTLYNYTVRYSGTTTVTTVPEKTTYSATATYTSKTKTKYSVTATVTYEMTEDSLAALKEKQEEERQQQEQMNNNGDNGGNSEVIDPEEQQKQEEEAKKAEEQRLKMIEQKEKEHKRNILLGCGAGLLALAGIFAAIYIIHNRKKDDNEDDIDQIMTKASSIKDSKNTAKKESEKERAAQQKREQAQKEKEEKARKAAEEKEKRRLEKQKEIEQKKQENIRRQESAEKSDFMKKLDQIKHDISTDDEK